MMETCQDYREIVSYPYPNPETPWNLVFATKMILAVFLISAYAYWIL
jgi:hypothetical protein